MGFSHPDWAAVTSSGCRGRFLADFLDHRYDELRLRMSGIAQLRTPALVIDGAADGCDLPGSFDEMGHGFTGGLELLTLPGVGHFLPREAPDVAAKAPIRHFISSAIS